VGLKAADLCDSEFQAGTSNHSGPVQAGAGSATQAASLAQTEHLGMKKAIAMKWILTCTEIE
jgi:hypothetical protein